MLSQFDAGLFSLICNQGAWEIRTTEAGGLSRIREIACRVFDEVLKHTPIRMFGFNFVQEFDIGRSQIGRALGRIACRAGLDFGVTEPASAEIKVAESRGDAIVSILAKPGSDDVSLSVATNVEYKLNGAESGFFAMGSYLDRDYDDRFREAGRIGQSIAQSVALAE